MHKLLEDYVSQVTPTNTATARFAEAEHAGDANEIRQHLTELMQGHQELGLAEDEAARAAIVQFGQAKKVRRELKQASLRSLVRDRAFWQAAAAATLAQIVLSTVWSKCFGYKSEVTAMAGIDLYYDPQKSFLFAFIWLVQLIVVGRIAARLCPRAAPLAASLFGIYQAVDAIFSFSGHWSHFTFGVICLFFVMMSVPPALSAFFAWVFAWRQSARRTLRV